MGKSFEISIIKEQLREAKPGDVFTFSELSALTGKDLQGKDYYILKKALDELVEENLVFENIRNVGYRRQTDAEIAASLSRMERINRQANKGLMEKACVNFNDLNSHERVLHNATMTTLRITKIISEKKSIKIIERKVKSSEAISNDIALQIEALEKLFQ